MKRILVPVDYSDHSLRSLALAAELARGFGATLDVIHVWERPTYVADSVLVGHGPSARPLGELVRENAEREMREFLAKAALPADVNFDARMISGEPAAALLTEIEKGEYDLVVVGTHGRSGFAHLLLGSVAEKLVRYSATPVLSVPRRTQRAEH